MICPNCESEYRDGFYRCADCDVALVHSLDEPAADDDEGFVENRVTSDLVAVLESKDASFLAELVELIETEQIPYLVQSGTALGIDILHRSRQLEWRAVLSVPSELKDQVELLADQVKTQREQGSAPSEPEAE